MSPLESKPTLKKLHGKTALWSPRYFAVSVGSAPIEVLIRYIKN
ncbi:transposase [Lyngbya aestuarii]